MNNDPGGPRLGSLAFRVCLRLAASPDALLTTPRIAVEFGANPDSVTALLRSAADAGWLECDQGGPGPGYSTEYTAGPRILALHGRSS